MKKSRLFAPLLASSIIVGPFGNFCSVLAEEFQDESALSFQTETTHNSTNLVVGNGKKVFEIFPEESFKLASHINISNDSVKKVILDAIPEAMKNNKPDSKDDQKYIQNDVINKATLTNVEKLKGTLVYEIQTPAPLKGISEDQIAIEYLSVPNAITSKSVKLTGNNNNTIQIELDINWGNAFKTYSERTTQFGMLNDMTFPDIDFDVKINNIRFLNNPNVNSRFTLYDKVTKYSVMTDENPIGAAYAYTRDPKLNETKGEYVEASVNVDINKSLTNIQGSSATLSVVRKKQKPSNNGTSTNRPNNSTDNVTKPDPNKLQTVLRLYNPNSGEHLFTTSAAERTYLVGIGWRNEVSDWSSPEISDYPIYRVYNPNNGDHHYTTSFAEKNHLVKLGWNYEGADLYAAEESSRNIPVYRMYNPNAKGAGSHHYTSTKTECDFLVAQGWNYEGIAWYGLRR